MSDRQWMVGRTKLFAGVGGAVVALALIAAVAAIAASGGGGTHAAAPPATSLPSATAASTATPTNTPAPSPTPIQFAGLLDGVPMSGAEWQERKDLLPIAVMFDNSPEASPQTGLDKADLVYEAFVEGGITRFMGVYWRQEAALLEPVRSARTPFVIWVDELGALYAHAGEATTDNAANAGGQIYEWGIKDLSAFGGVASGAYYRDDNRYAPHNLATSTAALRDAAARAAYAGPPTLEKWRFKADAEGTAALPEAGGIEVNFQGSRNPWQLVQWHWDPAQQRYLRFQFGGPHIDAATKEQLTFKNVIVMTVPGHVEDDAGHVLLDQVGQGKATVFIDGKQIEGTWKKTDRTARTRFYDADGIEIAFDRGSTFIEVIGLQSSVLVTKTAAELPPIPEYVPPPPAPPAATEPDDAPSPTAPAGVSPSPTGLSTPRPSVTATPPTGAAGSPSPGATGSPAADGTKTPPITNPSPTTGGTTSPEPATPVTTTNPASSTP